MNCRTKNQRGAFSVNNVPATKPAFGEVVPRKPGRQQATATTSATLTNTFENLDKCILQLEQILHVIWGGRPEPGWQPTTATTSATFTDTS